MSNDNATATVFIVEDDLAVTESLCFFLKGLEYTVSTHKTTADFLSHYRPNQPGCLLLDVNLPHMSGLEFQVLLQKKKWRIPVIFISGDIAIPDVVRTMMAGAVSFLTKPINNRLLLENINKAFSIDRCYREKLTIQEKIKAQCTQLTHRECEIMKLLIKGYSTKETANLLNISASTTEVHRARVLKKMAVNSVLELTNQFVHACYGDEDYVQSVLD